MSDAASDEKPCNKCSNLLQATHCMTRPNICRWVAWDMFDFSQDHTCCTNLLVCGNEVAKRSTAQAANLVEEKLKPCSNGGHVEIEMLKAITLCK